MEGDFLFNAKRDSSTHYHEVNRYCVCWVLFAMTFWFTGRIPIRALQVNMNLCEEKVHILRLFEIFLRDKILGKNRWARILGSVTLRTRTQDLIENIFAYRTNTEISSRTVGGTSSELWHKLLCMWHSLPNLQVRNLGRALRLVG